MAKGGTKQAESPQERFMAQHAREVYDDWKKRWQPLQKQLASSITAMGDADSAQRKLASGKASTDTAIQFKAASDKLEKTLANSGASLGSGRMVMSTTGLDDDAAKSRAMGLTVSDQQINDAYVQGLSALTSIGQGERAQVGDALGIQARQGAQQAQADAEIALANRAGNAELIGQFAGYGLQQGMKPKGSPGLPNMNLDAGIQPMSPSYA
jgi:hypothetical protein